MIRRSLVAAGAGLLLAAAFPPVGLWPLAIAAVALLTGVVIDQPVRRAALLGLIGGFVFFAVLLRWLSVVGWDAWLLLSGYSALWLALVAAATAAVTRVRGWVVWVPAVWVAAEAVRDRVPLGGWPWGRLGFSQASAPWLPAAALAGVPLLTAIVALAGVSLVWAWRHRQWRLPAASVVAAALAAPWLFALVPTPVDGPTRVIAVVQGDVPHTGIGQASADQPRQVLANHVTETITLAGEVAAGRQPQPDAVIWPESSSEVDPTRDAAAAAAISAAARAIGVPILVGTTAANPDDPSTIFNVGLVWDPVTGAQDRYRKQHPVPFGEYIPFRSLLADHIDRFSLIPRDYAAGTEPGVLPVGDVVVGDVICFEIAYDDLVRDTVRAGGQMLTVQTNNATYTGTGQTEQQLAMARIRSVEHARATVVAATNGVSAIFAPDGRVVATLPESTAGSLVAALPQRTALTVADRVAAWPELVAVVVTAAVLVLAAGRSRLRRNPRPVPPTHEPSTAASMGG